MAYAAANGTEQQVLDFMALHSGGSECAAVNLGCNGYKLTCSYGSGNLDKQLHYVVAPRLKSEAVDDDNLGVDGWIRTIMDSFGDMDTYSPFMHDKLQLWVSDVDAKAKQLEHAGYKVMRRSSHALDSSINANTVVGHAMVPIQGKVWDFVGLLPSDDEALRLGFTAWVAEECPLAHEVNIDLQTLTRHENMTNASWIAVSTSTSDIEGDGLSKVLGQFKDMTGAMVDVTKGKYCDVVSVHYYNLWEQYEGGSQGQQVYMKWVVNHAYQETKSGHSVAQYEDYLAKVHERYLQRPADKDESSRWRGWDHWLDQHVGLKYAGTSHASLLKSPPMSYTDDEITAYDVTLQATCLTMATEMNEFLLDEKIWVGKRSLLTDGDHYYTAQAGNTLAVEFNTECHYGQEGTTDICTCVAENSDNYALEMYGTKYSTCVTIYEEEDGHTSADGPWSDDKWTKATTDASGADMPSDTDVASESSSSGLSDDSNAMPFLAKKGGKA